MTIQKKITKGIYLVIDPSMDRLLLLDKLRLALQQPIAAVQIWDNFDKNADIEGFIRPVSALCAEADTPLLMNNRWEYLLHFPLDGVHFDQIPDDMGAIRQKVGRTFISGLTCNNDLSWVRWAAAHRLDYISFCSVFPSSTANSCELVDFDTVRQARALFSRPIFLAGGIRPENMDKLNTLPYDGVAVVSGIMSVADPIDAIKKYSEQLIKKQ
ncbi:thiamine phosphate synthase [Limibacterium fermenti]|uniref:thiamine phosphate synthase n=1 Tax=Limibacterium fermenti TaxID=3229863 RepID=UPI000E8C4D2D|nr:thiamine phosphate synthase [Porphyromonadaceae bacterium]